MMQQLIDDLLMEAQALRLTQQELLANGQHELYRHAQDKLRRTMGEVNRLKKRQEELRKEQTQAHEQTH